MPHELEEKIRKYLTGLTSQVIQQKITEGTFPFFGTYENDCLDLAWKIIAERRLKNA